MVENLSGHAREARDHPSVVYLGARGHFGGQTSKMV